LRRPEGKTEVRERKKGFRLSGGILSDKKVTSGIELRNKIFGGIDGVLLVGSNV